MMNRMLQERLHKLGLAEFQNIWLFVWRIALVLSSCAFMVIQRSRFGRPGLTKQAQDWVGVLGEPACAALNLLLPYVPHTLHRKWQKTNTNQRDDAFLVSYFLKYFDLGVFQDDKKRFERFAGWQKKVLKNPLNEYVTYIANNRNQEVPINFGIQIKDMKPETKMKLDEACAIVHAVFPNFCLEIPAQQT